MRLLFLSLVLTASSALAQTVPAGARQVALSYVREAGVDECPDERWIRQAVTSRLGFDPFADDAEVRVEAKISSDARGLVGTLGLTDRSGARLGKRELRSDARDCLELSSAMELAISIAVDPQYL